MYLGRIVELGATDEIFATPRHPYTQALLSAVPVPDPGAARRRLILEGDVPSPIAPPPGCHLHPRCPHVRARCREEAPALAEEGVRRVACHVWREIAPPAEAQDRLGTRDNPALVRLQAAVARAALPGNVKGAPP
jgi:oligopeptide/dipeptide ABC transporter ATP-binding protein